MEYKWTITFQQHLLFPMDCVFTLGKKLYRAKLLAGVTCCDFNIYNMKSPSLPLHSSVCLQQPCSQFYSKVDLLTLRNQGRVFSRLCPKPMGKCHTLLLHCLLQLCLPDTFKYIYVYVCKYSILYHYIRMISKITDILQWFFFSSIMRKKH